jgi:hypothetical protein
MEESRDNRPVREMTLPEEILALEQYNVPKRVVERIYKKVQECGEAETRMIRHRDSLIQELQEKTRNRDAVIDALGAYLAIKNAGYREV